MSIGTLEIIVLLSKKQLAVEANIRRPLWGEMT